MEIISIFQTVSKTEFLEKRKEKKIMKFHALSRSRDERMQTPFAENFKKEYI
jgi:hypothetical protein